MRQKRIIIPGNFVEAYLYFDFAWLFESDGTIRAFDIQAFCEKRLNGDADAVSALFSDNRPISEQKYYNVALAEKAKSVLNSESVIEVSEEDVNAFSYIFSRAISFKSLLDTQFYYGRGYIGTDASIIQIGARSRDDLQSQRRDRNCPESLKQRKVSERPARAFKCRFGAVGASCGNDGGVVGLGAASADRDWKVSFKPFAEKSFGIELNGYALTNLVASNCIEMYSVNLDRSKMLPRNTDGDDEKILMQITEIGKAGFVSETRQVNGILSMNEAGCVFLFKNTLWQFSPNRPAQNIRLMKDLRVQPEPTSKSIRQGVPGRVLAMTTTTAGVLAETDDAVFVFNRRRWTPLVNDEVYSVRGYQGSKRYKNVVTAVTRDRVELISLWD